MHRLTIRTYVGTPGETVTLVTHVGGSGQLNVALDGQPIPDNTQFQLPSAAGGRSTLQIALFGPVGATCVVGLSVVDGGTDGDFLICQPHNPAPVNFYSLSVAAATSVAAFAKMKLTGAIPATKAEPGRAKKTPKKGKKG